MQKNKKVYVVEIRWPFKEIVILESQKELKDMIRRCKENAWSFWAYSQII